MKLITSIKGHYSRILTGIQPTGNLHIGNYLGSVTNLLQLQHQHQSSDIFLSIVDYHSLTTIVQHQHSKVNLNHQIGKHTHQMAKMLICSGVSQQKNMTLFVQSKIKQHTELCWILGCFSPHHWLNSMIQYKQKSAQNSNSGLGIYSYPVLMTADILLYKATHVPVGEDQKQHLQLSRKIVQRFNKIVKKEVFPSPKYIVAKNPKVMSLTDPTKKMSKSDSNDKSRINLSDKEQDIALKIKKAITDSDANTITYDPQQRKGLSNLLRIYSTLSERKIEQVVQELREDNMRTFKQKLTRVVVDKIVQIQYRMKEISQGEVKQILRDGQMKARTQAQKTMKSVKEVLNLYE